MSQSEPPAEESFDLDELPTGSYLFAGPPHIEKFDVMLEFLATDETAATAGIAISTNTGANTVCDHLAESSVTADEWGDSGPVADDRAQLLRDYGVIDCASGNYAGNSRHDGIASVPSPGDLTAIDVRLTDQLKRLQPTRREHLRLGFHSLSTVMMYTNIHSEAETEAVFEFLNVLSSRLATLDATALFSIDPGMHDDRTLQTLAHAVDGVIEVRMPESTFEVRAQRVSGVPSSWTPATVGEGSTQICQSDYMPTDMDTHMSSLESGGGDSEAPEHLLDSAALLSKKWNPMIIQTLDRTDGAGFSDLETRLEGISSKVLTDSLEQLQEYGVVERTELSESPLRVEYTLTERGADLETVIQSLAEWGETHLAPDDEQVVLVADDDRRAVTMHETWLEEEYTVRTARDGEQARQTLDSAVDVAVLDRRMPGLTGDEVVDWLRKQGHDCRVVMVTGEQPSTEILELGFDEYLTKPVLQDELKGVVDTLFERAEYDRTVRQYLAVRSKLTALRAEHSIEELEASEEYVQYKEKLESLEVSAAEITEEAVEPLEPIGMEHPK